MTRTQAPESVTPRTGTERILRHALTKLRQYGSPGGRLCDIPCGTGFLSVQAARDGWSVDPYDIAPEVWEGGDLCTARWADLNAPLEIEDHRYDALVCCEGMEHIENPYLVLREFRRILRPGGIMVVSIPNTIDLRQRWRFLRRGYLGHYPPAVPEHINAMGTFMLCHALVGQGCTLLDMDAPKIYGGPFMRLLARLLPYRRGTGLPEEVNAMLSQPRILCGRTALFTARTPAG